MFPFQFNSSEHITYNRNNKKHKENQVIETPDYFNLISEEDQCQYRELQKILTSPENRYARNRRIETLKESLEEIRKFCIRNDENDWKRCLVCGVIWLNENKSSNDVKKKNEEKNNFESISINIRQLKVILDKSKSTINGAMAKMGFVTFPTKGDDQDILYKAMPYFEGKYFEMRQWTIRKRKLNENEKINENEKPKTKEDEIPFISFDDYENEDLKFGEFGFSDQDFWFNNFDFEMKKSYDFTIMTQNNHNSNNLNLLISNQISKSKINSNIFTSAELVLQLNNLLMACSIFRDSLERIIKGSKSIIVANGIFLSYFYQLYLIYTQSMMAYLAGLAVPRTCY